MTITSKHHGKCKQCGGHIGIGETIIWEKGEGIRHTACPASPIPPRPSGERARGEGKTFRPVPKPGRQAPRTYPPKVAAQIIPAGAPGPYHGKFQRVRQLAEECEAVVGSAALDAERAAIVAPGSRSPQPAPAAVPGRRTTVSFHMHCPTRTL